MRRDLGLIFHSRGDSLKTMRPEPKGYLGTQNRRYLSVLFAATLSLFLVLAFAAEAWARSSGGRYGGRSGFSQSRSGSRGGGWSGSSPAPTRPYNVPSSPGYPPPSYSPPMSSPGWGFLPFLLPFLWGGGWGGGGGGSAGFGFGGVLGLLIILGIVALVGRVLLRNLAAARRDRQELSPSALSAPPGGERYAVVKCQIALLSTARSLQRELQTYANAATTDTMAGLAAGLQDAVMALMRYSQYWRYGAVQVQHAATLDDAERAFNQAVSQERAKLSAELTVNIDGVRRQPSAPETTSSGEVGQYIVVTLIVATGYPDFTSYQTPSLKDIETTLQRLGNLLTSDLLALEVIWSPENPDDALTEDELIAEYPELSGL
jgi:uncharacterized membrane protein